MNSKEIANKLGLIHVGEEDDIKDIFFDSREPIQNGVFVAIKGEKTNGHIYIKDLLDKDIKGFIVSEDFDVPPNSNKFFLKAKDPIKAIQDIAKLKRDNLKAKVIAVSGSAGKTTSKELIAHVLPGKVHKTYKNYNSKIGLPKVVISAKNDIDFLVLEMGATQVGDVKTLTDIANQHVGVVISIGEEHLEFFGSIENVIKGNFEVFDSKNLTSGIYPKAFERFYYKSNGLSFCAFRKDADIKIENTSITKKGTHMRIEHIDIDIPVLSFGIAESVGATIGVLKALNMDWRELKDRFETFEGAPGRMQVFNVGNITLIDDTYNSNPASLKNAVLTLDSFNINKIIVLGDMLELGEYSKSLHEKAGVILKQSRINNIYLYGEHMKHAYEVLKNTSKEVYHFKDKEDLIVNLIKSLKPKEEYVVLIKGSRGMRMEDITMTLKDRL